MGDEKISDELLAFLKNKPYFYGSCRPKDVVAILKGGCLPKGRPIMNGGQNYRAPANLVDRVYLTPSFQVAENRAAYGGGEPIVFAVDVGEGVEDIQIDEEDVGWLALNAVKNVEWGKNITCNANYGLYIATNRIGQKTGVGKFGRYMLKRFLEAGEKSGGKYIEEFLETARVLLAGKMTKHPLRCDERAQITLGYALMPGLTQETILQMMKLGANINVAGNIRPTSVAEFRVMKKDISFKDLAKFIKSNQPKSDKVDDNTACAPSF